MWYAISIDTALLNPNTKLFMLEDELSMYLQAMGATRLQSSVWCLRDHKNSREQIHRNLRELLDDLSGNSALECGLIVFSILGADASRIIRSDEEAPIYVADSSSDEVVHY